jgi:signal peptidase I
MAMQMTDPDPMAASPAFSPAPVKDSRRALSLVRQAAQFVMIGSLAFASYFVISHYVLQSVKVVGRSMVPTLFDSQHYLLNRWIYHFHGPRPRDIVVLRDPSDGGFSVKRVIATPGDSIYLRDGNVYVNGCRLAEEYLAPNTPTFTDSKYRDQLILCGKDQYFVLGDNRLNSIDSRVYGPVLRQNILGPLVR